MSNAVNIGKAIKILRVTKGVRQSDIAKGIGVDSSYISRLERGERDPGLQTLRDVAKCLGVKLSELFSLAECQQGKIVKRLTKD